MNSASQQVIDGPYLRDILDQPAALKDTLEGQPDRRDASEGPFTDRADRDGVVPSCALSFGIEADRAR